MIGGMSDYLENKLLDHSLGKAAYTMPTNYLALFTAAPSDAGGGTEVSGGSYARQNVSTAMNSAASGQATTGSLVAFPDATANWGTVLAWATFDASTAGNMLWWGWLGTGAELPGTAAASTDIFTAIAHGLANDDRVILQAPEGGTLPTGVSANTAYYVVSVTTNTFQLSTTQGGSAINITADGAFSAYKIVPKTINNGDGFKFNAGQLTFKQN